MTPFLLLVQLISSSVLGLESKIDIALETCFDCGLSVVGCEDGRKRLEWCIEHCVRRYTAERRKEIADAFCATKSEREKREGIK